MPGIVRIVSAALLIAAGSAFGGLAVMKHLQSSSGTSAAIGGSFTLTAAGGRTVTDADLAGRPYAIFFGYTHCPDVCPTTLAEIDSVRDELGPVAEPLQVVFVSVDPERDTPQSLADYVGSFSHPVLGLTGTEEQIVDITRKYRVVYQKVPGDGAEYSINHTATVFLMDKSGKFVGTIGYTEDHENHLKKIRRLVAGM